MEAARAMRPWTFRVENIPPETTAGTLKDYFHTEDQPYIQVRSIVPAVDCEGPDGELTATISFQTRDETITAPRVLDDTISVDSDFHGFTPLSQPKGPIAADIIAVTGLAAHAYGSWAHSSRNMWLRDYLPKDVANARVLIYGYPSQLQGSASSGILADHTNNFIHRLLSMRELARCQDRPIVFIGHSLGCLIIKKALSDVNGSVGRYSSRLPVCAIIFFGAPHRGLQTEALETLVKSQPTEMMIRELQARSPTLNELNDKFRFVASDIDILTCFELWQSKTAVEIPDGSWKREGKPEMMVYQDSAQLNFPKEKMVSCHADHSQMAKLRRGESGAYPDIKRAIKQALLHVAEDQANAGLSRLQLRLGGKAVVEEHWRHNEDDIKKPRPERPPFPAENSHLDDDQSPGSSSPEPQGKKIDVLHERDVVSNPSPPVSDGPKHGAIFQNSETISDSTITPPSTQNMSQDGGEIRKGGAEALEVTMQRAIDASLDRSNAPSSPVEKKRSGKPMGSVKDPTLRLELCSASREGDVEKVRSLLAQGCSIHESSEDLIDPDKDAFLLAAEYGRLDVLKLLLEHNCDVSKRSLRGNTALHLISFDPEIKPKPVIESLVILLLEHGVPLEVKGVAGATPLVLSAVKGKTSIAECLLEHGADIHSTENDGVTALHDAARKGYYEIVALLISKDADIHSTDNGGYTALHLAAKNGQHEVVALLISKGADIHSNLNDNYTALHLAATNGQHEVVALLIAKGADIYSTDKDGCNALHWAAQVGHHEVVALLIANGADIYSTDKDGCNALHWAARRGHYEVVALLVLKGADTHPTSNHGYTALHWAAKNNHHEVVALLVLKGADIHPTSNDSYTALHLAAKNGHHEVVALLIAKGAPLEIRTIDIPGRPPCTPLQISCYAGNGSGESAKLLLEAGASKEAITGTSSRRVLHTAAQLGNLEVVNELLAFGVEIDAADKDNRRALHLAKCWGHWRIIEALLAKGANPLLINKYGVPPSRETWDSDAISQEGKAKCLELLDDAEKAWLEKRRREKEKRRQERKEQGEGRFSRFIANLTD